MKNITTFIISAALIITIFLLIYITSQNAARDSVTPAQPIVSLAKQANPLNNSALIKNPIETKLAPKVENNKPNKFSVTQGDLDQTTNQLLKTKNELIIQDENGNYLVEISTLGLNSREWILSNSPIYFATEDQFDNEVSGCAADGYYVELKSILSLVIETENENRTYQFMCTYNPNSNLYLLEPYDTPKPKLQNSINKLITNG